MDMLEAGGDVLARGVGWVIIGLMGYVGGGLAQRIPGVRDAKPWLQWVVTLAGGGVAVLVAWLVAFYVFHVDVAVYEVPT